MSYYCQTDRFTTAAGDALPGYIVRALHKDTGAVIAIFSDESGTAITDNKVAQDALGNYSFFIPHGIYSVECLDPASGARVAFRRYVNMAGDPDAVTDAQAAQTAAAASATAAAASLTAATSQATNAANSAASASDDADRAEAALGSISDGLPEYTYLTKAAMTAAVASIPADGFAQVMTDEDKAGARTIYQKQTGTMVFIRYAIDTLPGFTFANRPDPALYSGISDIRITDERYGIQPCYSDGTRWRRRSDGRTAQSSVITYYVDGTGGNDANSGTSAAPIKTLTQLKALVAALPAYRRCGLRFAFKRGTSIGGTS